MQAAREARRDRGHHENGGGVVEKGSDRHGQQDHQPQRAKRWQVGHHPLQPGGDEVRATGGLDRSTNRDQGRQEYDYRPLDGGIGLVHGHHPQEQHSGRCPSEGNRHGDEVGRHQDHRGRQDPEREPAPLAAAQSHVALAQG